MKSPDYLDFHIMEITADAGARMRETWMNVGFLHAWVRHVRTFEQHIQQAQKSDTIRANRFRRTVSQK